jgi:hypothetical protein
MLKQHQSSATTAMQLVNCSHETLHAPRIEGQQTMNYVAITPHFLYPRAMEASRSLPGKAKKWAYEWNNERPSAIVTAMQELLRQDENMIMIDLDGADMLSVNGGGKRGSCSSSTASTNHAFFALLAASEGKQAIAWTACKELVCPALYANPRFHTVVTVLESDRLSSSKSQVEKAMNAILPALRPMSRASSRQTRPLLILHLQDCQDVQHLQQHYAIHQHNPKTSLYAVHCLVFGSKSRQGRGTILDPAPLQWLSKSLRPWIYDKATSMGEESWKPWNDVRDEQELLDSSILEGNGIHRIVFTNYALDEHVNDINATVPQHKWYWDAK